jgi:hypothetical protein
VIILGSNFESEIGRTVRLLRLVVPESVLISSFMSHEFVLKQQRICSAQVVRVVGSDRVS